ncbi:hypothetical protein [Sandarakinorhabdus sp.]|uniref:hypothetical protein n=1 Tax=Sandarakinorhabdus sp. TaxID=1916663 RepID=UPI00286E443F|nr:hypothetical protein [Sandarakinorhabdus sp.]
MKLAVILAALACAAAAPAAAQLSSTHDARANTCMKLAQTRPDRAIAYALGWRAEGGGAAARHCLAVAQFQGSDYNAAFASFEAAAIAAEDTRDGRAVTLWREAGEAALIAERPEQAVRYLGRALARPGGIEISPRAEAALRQSRASALVDLKRLDEAADDLAQVTALDPEQPQGWLLRATCARYRADWPVAESAIVEAARLVPDSASVQFEAGNIAAAQSKTDLAKAAWAAAASADPESDAGKAAQKALTDMAAAATPP